MIFDAGFVTTSIIIFEHKVSSLFAYQAGETSKAKKYWNFFKNFMFNLTHPGFTWHSYHLDWIYWIYFIQNSYKRVLQWELLNKNKRDFGFHLYFCERCSNKLSLLHATLGVNFNLLDMNAAAGACVGVLSHCTWKGGVPFVEYSRCQCLLECN